MVQTQCFCSANLMLLQPNINAFTTKIQYKMRATPLLLSV